tara:strand:- start:386 stop:961 length:576 start_codon:yes stop_codon:yes gene_type:complete
MIKIGILGDIGSGKSFVAKQFGYPVFNADVEVDRIYKKDRNCFIKLNKEFPKQVTTFPVNKKEITKSILSNPKNLKKIIKIVHPLVRKKMNKFIYQNRNKKMIIFDIPLLLENNLNKSDYVLVFVQAKKEKIINKLKKRNNFDSRIFRILRKSQLPLVYKKKKSNFIINNNFSKKSVKKSVKLLKNIIFNQ